MSQAYDALMGLSNDEIAAYTADSVTEPHIVIGEDRFITIPNALKRIAVQYDHNVETVTFDCPRYWDEHDLSTMPIYINYILPNKEIGSYMAENITAEESIIHFDWTISNNITQTPGPITFLVCAKTTDDNGIETTHWNSELNSEMYVSEGLEGGVQSAIDMYPDIITQLLTRMTAVEEVKPIAENAAAAAAASATEAQASETSVSEMVTEVETFKKTAANAAVAASKHASNAASAAASQVGTKADAIIRSEEGGSIILTDASDDPLRGLRVMGRTEQATTTGKNQVDMSGYEFNDSDYTHMLAPSNISANDFYNFMRAHPGENIIYSMTITGTASGIDIGSIRFYDSNSDLIVALAPNTPHTIKTDLPEIFALSYIYGSGTGASVKNIQVEFGSVATEYEPYTGAKASPNPDYPQELVNVENTTVSVNGINLFNMDAIKDTDTITKLDDGTVSVSHYYNPTALTMRQLCPGLVSGVECTLYVNSEGSTIIYLTKHGHVWTHTGKLTITDDILDSHVCIYGKDGQVDGSTIIRNIQVVVTNTSTKNDDHKYIDSQLMPVPYTLRGIPVTRNGNYTDSNWQQWICDEVDFERGVLIQRVGELAVDNSLTYFYNTDNFFLHTGSDIFTNVAAWETRILGTHFVPVGNGIGMSDYGWFQFNGNGGIRFRIEGVESVEALAEWITNNPDARVIYPYVTPIETELTADDLTAYKALYTNHPNSVILNSANTHMYLDYNVDTEMYIEDSLAASTEGLMYFIGTSMTQISQGSTLKNIIMSTGIAHTAKVGMVCKCGNNSYVFDGTQWNAL